MSDELTESQKLEIRQGLERTQLDRDNQRAEMKERAPRGRSEAKRLLALLRGLDVFMTGTERAAETNNSAAYAKVELLRGKAVARFNELCPVPAAIAPPEAV